MSRNPINSTLYYLTRKSLYESVKPYFCYIPPNTLNGFPTTNQEYIPVRVAIHDIRTDQDDTEPF